MVACAVSTECRDIILFDWTRKCKQQRAPPVWGWLLSAISFIRLFLTLPELVQTVAGVIIYPGRDSLSVCFNKVALVFMLEIDNVIFKTMLIDTALIHHSEIGSNQSNDRRGQGS